jgi:hypothetical protein
MLVYQINTVKGASCFYLEGNGPTLFHISNSVRVNYERSFKNKDEFFFPNEDSNSIILKGLNNMTVRVINNNQIDGFLRCSVREEENGIYLTPCNIYCIVDNGKYSFY